MGLDQYAERRDSNGESSEISCWRKHNALQGWMEKLWSIKTGKPESDLNCQELKLEMEDLNKLEKAVLDNDLPQTEGFFFGSDSRYDDYQKKETMKFIMEAKLALSEGDEVFYSCWW